MNDITEIKMKIKDGKTIAINDIDTEQVGEFAQVNIDTNAPIKARFEKFMSEVENPYIFKSGNMMVKMEYSNSDLNLEKCLNKIIQKKVQ